MALAYDATSGGKDGTGAVTSLTWSHTCTTSANRILVVEVSISQASGGSVVVSGVTYNAVAMTLANSADANGAGGRVRVYQYYLIAPATGANNVVATISGTLNGNHQFAGTSKSYTGANQSSQPDSSGTNSLTASTVTTFTVSDTVVASNCWLTGGASEDAGDIAAGAAGSGTTYRGAAQFNLVSADSNATVSTGAQTLNWGRAGNAGNLVGVVMAIKPLQEVTLSVTQGSYTYTGYDIGLIHGYVLSVVQGAYTLTGQAINFVLDRLWDNETKSSTTMTNSTKASTSWTNGTKDSTSFTNQNKS